MYIDYLILGVISLGTFVWAYYNRPDGDEPSDDQDGGVLISGDSTPTDTPPSLDVHLPDSGPGRVRSPDAPEVEA
jgi:hypothetical protein